MKFNLVFIRNTGWVFALVSGLGLVEPALGASFDCKKVSLTPVERTVCSDNELSKLDEELASVYKTVLSKTHNPKKLQESQREWLKSEREKSAVTVTYGGNVNVDGLKFLYRVRIIELGASVMTLPKILGSYTKLTPLTQVDPDKPDHVAFIQIGEHEDYVNLVQNPDGKVQVSLWLTYGNSHLCQMEGIGVWKENHVLVEQKDKWSTCNLKIISDGNVLLIRDQDFDCTRMFCGARGSLDNTIVPRKKN